MFSYKGRVSRMRPLKVSDKEACLEWRNDPDVREKALWRCLPVTEVMEVKWYETALKGDDHTRVAYAIEDVEDDKLVGFIQLYNIDWISGTAYCGIVIGERDRQGKGIGADAMGMMLRYAFECLNLRKICLDVGASNESAIALYEKVGFKSEGRLSKQIYIGKGYQDVIIMALFKDDYRVTGDVPPTVESSTAAQ